MQFRVEEQGNGEGRRGREILKCWSSYKTKIESHRWSAEGWLCSWKRDPLRDAKHEKLDPAKKTIWERLQANKAVLMCPVLMVLYAPAYWHCWKQDADLGGLEISSSTGCFLMFHLLQETKLLIIFSKSYSPCTELSAYNSGTRDILCFSWRGLRLQKALLLFHV